MNHRYLIAGVAAFVAVAVPVGVNALDASNPAADLEVEILASVASDVCDLMVEFGVDAYTLDALEDEILAEFVSSWAAEDPIPPQPETLYYLRGLMRGCVS